MKYRADEHGGMRLIKCLNSPGRSRPDFMLQEATGDAATKHVPQCLALWFPPPHGPRRSGMKPKAKELEDHRQSRNMDWQETSILPSINYRTTTCLWPANANTLQ